MRPATAAMAMTKGQRKVLEALSRSRVAARRDVQRAQALLIAADGVANTRIAEAVGVSATTVASWRRRFASEGLRGLGSVRPGRGRKPSISPEQVAEIVRATLEDAPPGETRWSCRSMARAQGVSSATVQRVWSACGLKPHRVQTSEFSDGTRLEQKVVDVVGLYLNPPEHAVALCMDSKSQIRARDPGVHSLPMLRGRAGTRIPDRPRNRTTTLFAALDALGGAAIGPCPPPHRHLQLVKFLGAVDREVPEGLEIHVILETGSTHGHAEVRGWLAEHPRIQLHLTPRATSWLDLFRRWSGPLAATASRRGSFGSAPDLIGAIEHYLQADDGSRGPFVWSATTTSILSTQSTSKDRASAAASSSAWSARDGRLR
ncbi:MAG: IS630 family transposase [Gaiellaceae bacterium]